MNFEYLKLTENSLGAYLRRIGIVRNLKFGMEVAPKK